LKITNAFRQDPRIYFIQGALFTLYLGVLGPEEKYFGLRGAYYPFKVAIFQCFTVAVQALGRSPCWAASLPLPNYNKMRLPFFGLVSVSGLSLPYSVGTVSIPPFF
jgi:hypothetical protein